MTITAITTLQCLVTVTGVYAKVFVIVIDAFDKIS
jgi:hypothetical protein